MPDDNWWSDIQKNNFVKTFHNWGELYKIEFELTVTSLPSVNLTNVFHLSDSSPDDECQNLDLECKRIPAVFIYLRENGKPPGIGFHSFFNGFDNIILRKFEVGKPNQITIQQYRKDGHVYFGLSMNNGTFDFVEENKQPNNFPCIYLYASDPWHAPFTSNFGTLRNVKIQQGVLDDEENSYL